jgi:aspartate carbamoyltransferase catalytic subunit
MPVEIEKMGVEVAYTLQDAVQGADVVMMLRVQLERQGRMAFPSVREYFQLFGLTTARLAGAKDDVIVMHPGPMNRGVEIASEAADSSRFSVILEQVKHGVSVRMAVLYLLSGIREGT